MYRHLIFDLDGTVADTLPSIALALNLTLKHFNKNFTYTVEETRFFVGHGTPYLIQKAFKNNIDNFDEVFDYYVRTQIKTHLDNATIFPGLKEKLQQLRDSGCTLYIATNKPAEVAPIVINKLYGDGFFKEIVAQKKDMPKKPDPYVINQIIKRYNLKPNECLYIGDSEVDLLSAKNAGIDACLVKYGYGHYDKINEALAKYIVNKPNDFQQFL